MAIIVPTIPVYVKRPKDNVSEHDKFANNGEWFLDYARWYVQNYYNTYSSSNSYYQPVAAGTSTAGTINSQGNPISSGGTVVSAVDEMMQNYEYFYGNQDNKIFNFLTKGVNNNALPNVMIKGQEIRSLADHVRGKCLEMIQPIEDNISCETISQNTLVKRKEVFDKIDLASEIEGLLEKLGEGVKYQPAGEIDYSNPSQVEKAKKKVREQYATTATIIGRNAYYKCNLAEKFMNAASDTIIGNLAGIEFKEHDGQLTSTYIPCYQAIYDYSTWGEFGEGQRLGGYIVPCTYEELIYEYPDMNPQWKEELEEVMTSSSGAAAAYMEYYNQPFTNVLWYYNNEKWISKATVYWIDECELPYVQKENQFGGRKVQKIDPYKTYQVATEKDGQKTFEAKKGHELKGGTKVYKVHKAVIAGNKWLLEYGYDTYQVRPFGDKKLPEIPIKFFCQGKMGGYVKSIVSRLKPKQDELDAVRYRMREYVASDLWGIFINGKKLDESYSALNVVNDLRTTHVSVVPASGDEDADRQGINDLIKVVENKAMQAIREYMVLKADIQKEMQDILNIPPVALGDQSATIGKGVQEATISRSELSGLPFYNSLSEYFRRVLAYAANKNKMILIDNKNNGKVVLPVSNKDIEILELTKEFDYEDLNCYLNPNDRVSVMDLSVLRQNLMAYSQNPTIENAEAMLNTLKIMRSKSFQEGIAMFESYIDDKRRDQEKQQLREATTAQQQEAFILQSKALAESQKQVSELTSKLAQINLTKSWDLNIEKEKHGMAQDDKLSDIYIEQITGLIQEQLAAVQPAGQPQEQAAISE